MVSFAIAGVVSMLAALCYAELAAAVPTAGSSYTYAYTTIGEIFAWIIAWDLILEFALGAAVVARGWSGYLGSAFGLPHQFFGETDSTVNLGAVFITLVLGVVAAVGIRESKLVTNTLVMIKVTVCIFVILAGAFFIKASNLTPWFPPSKPIAEDDKVSGLAQPLWQFVSGVDARVLRHRRRLRRRGRRLLRLLRLRGRRQPRRGDREPRPRHAARAPRHAGDLHACSTSAVCFVLTGDGEVHRPRRGRPDLGGLPRRRARAGPAC